MQKYLKVHLGEHSSSVPSVEEIMSVIIDKELTPSICEDSGQAEWSVGEARKLAQAIHNLIMKGRSQ